MTRTTRFKRTFFPAHIIREAIQSHLSKQNLDECTRHNLSLEVGKDSWTYDSVEQFLADYPRQTGYAYACVYGDNLKIKVCFHLSNTEIEVEAKSHGPIIATFSIFEKAAESCKLPLPLELPKPKE